MPPSPTDHDHPQSGLCIWQEFTVPYRFPVSFTRDAFDPANPTLAAIVGAGEAKPRVLAIVDAGVAAADPSLGKRMENYAAAHGGTFSMVTTPQVLPGGEACKNGPYGIEKLHILFLEHQLCRHSYVVAVGGGAFLDAAGFAASTAHRGIRLVRLPTTTLSQNDAGIGVKNGYNAFGRKNWVGTFGPPHAVIVDFDFLRTLPARHCRAGMAEAVKVAVIKDASFFDFLSRQRTRLAAFSSSELEELIIRCARIHLDHVASGDPFERGSARPLDFGHWFAHALEDLSGGKILHGEAVAIGMALDCRYACQVGLLPPGQFHAIISLLIDLGFSLHHPLLPHVDLIDALERFRQHLGGRLSITLPTGIGSTVEAGSMDFASLDRSRHWLKAARRKL